MWDFGSEIDNPRDEDVDGGSRREEVAGWIEEGRSVDYIKEFEMMFNRVAHGDGETQRDALSRFYFGKEG
jgi:hypothetical protein